MGKAATVFKTHPLTIFHATLFLLLAPTSTPPPTPQLWKESAVLITMFYFNSIRISNGS